MTNPTETGDVAVPNAVTTTFAIDGDINELGAHLGLTAPYAYTVSRDESTKIATVVITGK